MIFKESFEYCPYIRAMQKEKRRNAAIKDADKAYDEELDIPDSAVTKVKAHLKRRVDRQTKTKWVSYAAEFASEIAFSGDAEKEEMRRYLQMTRDTVMEMDRKEKKCRKESANKKKQRQFEYDTLDI